jgi:MYXO-CTERM domain-containing protein
MQELDYFVSPLALSLHIDAVAGVGYDFGEVVGSTLWNSSTRAGTMDIPAVFVASRTSVGPDPGTGGRRGGGSMLFIALHPNAMNDSAGKVADLTLTYRLPGSGQVITQQVTLAYPNNPTETPDPPYLSMPEMAVRYAIYNMYLGFRAATQAQAYDATSILTTVKAAAVAWNQTHEDPDIAADIALIDQYVANLAAVGYGGGSDYGTPGDDTYGDHGPNYYGSDQENVGCEQAGRGPIGGALGVVGAVLLAVRRRRRRSC